MNHLFGARPAACWILPFSLILSPTLVLAQSEPGHDAHPPAGGAQVAEHAGAEAGHGASEDVSGGAHAEAQPGEAEHAPAAQAPAS